MEKDRSAKIIAIVALFVGVMGLTIGFSTFTQMLTISTRANVTPPSTDFKVQLSTDEAGTTGTVTGVPTTGATVDATPASLTKDTISGINATFTAPGQSVTYSFYAVNLGEYDAYLNAVTFANIAEDTVAKKCTAKYTEGDDAADDTKVQAACDAISVKVSVNGTEYTGSNGSISSHILSKTSGSEPVVVTITYAADGARADGDFDVAFGDISLNYGSVD